MALSALGLIVIAVYLTRMKVAQHMLEEKASTWPTTEATIRQYSTVVVQRTSLPCFYFSYVIDGEYYSGSFALYANLDEDRIEALGKEMVNRKIAVRYDPNQPSS
jgi:hypothetical protein